MTSLDRAFFTTSFALTAARIYNNANITQLRRALVLSNELLLLDNRVRPVRLDPDPEKARMGGKCLLLRPEVVYNGVSARQTT